MTSKPVSDLTTRLTPGNLGHAISHSIKIRKPMFIWGPPGVGKSDIVREVAAAKGMDVIDVRLSQMEHSDIRGIPYLTTESTGSVDERIARAVEGIKKSYEVYQTELSELSVEFATPATNVISSLTLGREQIMKWAPPEFLPRDPNTKAILFLDEFSSVSNGQTLAACYQLLLDRRVGEYKLPDGVAIIAAGNRVSDRGVAFRLPSPIANRMTHIELMASAEDWINWAVRKRVNPDVIGYVAFSKASLAAGFDTASPDIRGFATPRSWVSVSDILNNIEEDNNMPPDVIHALVAGTVGDGEAIKFMDYRKRSAELPLPSDVLTGKIKEFTKPTQREDAGLGFSLVYAVVYELEVLHDQVINGKLSAEEFHDMVNNFFGFSLKSFRPEIVINGIREITSRAIRFKLDVRKLSNFTETRKKYASLLHKQASVA